MASYDSIASTQSRAYIFWFTLSCLYFVLFSEYTVGILWIPIYVVGIFFSSNIIAFPAMLIKMGMVGLFALFGVDIGNPITILLSIINACIDLSFIVLQFFALKWLLEKLST